ncbi:MAG: hypothetical protein QM484_04955 [Woeseiaceae bacterium]
MLDRCITGVVSQLSSLLLIAILFQPVAANEAELVFIERLPYKNEVGFNKEWVLIDTRVDKLCKSSSIEGARCLSTKEILAPYRRFPSLREITWLLGTLGLSGKETVVIAGLPGLNRDFVAGVFYLAGQRKIKILKPSISRVLKEEKYKRENGRGRSMSRKVIYEVRPREEQIILRQELWQIIKKNKALRLLDARSDMEYWGKKIRGIRGGHIPGAERWDRRKNKAEFELKTTVRSIFYAHDPFETIALFVRMQARETKRHSVFIEGWRSWAASSLPVDAESFRD